MQNTEVSEQTSLSDELAEIANRINKRVSFTAYEVGQNLIQAKELCKHGEWLPFLEQAGIQERSAQRMMRYVRLVGEVDDIQALPSMHSLLEKDKQDTYQAVENLVDVIAEGIQLLEHVFNLLADNDEASAAIRLGASIIRNIGKWIDEKDGSIKPDNLSDLAKGVRTALEDAKMLMLTECDFHEQLAPDQFVNAEQTSEAHL